MKEQNSSRRDFIKKSVVGAAAFSIVPRFVLGGQGYLAPSDHLTKGVIGVGNMGRGHFGYAGTKTVAICDVDTRHLAAAQRDLGGGIKEYHDFRELIKSPEVDIVHIATPPHWHGLMSIEAAKAGKDIWCEKPMTRTIGEGKKVKEAIAQHGNMFRLNTWFRFKDDFYGMNVPVSKIKKLVDTGMLGWPLKVTISKHTGFDWKFYWVGKENLPEEQVPAELDYEFWLGPAPYKPYNKHRTHTTFRGYWDYDGGGLGDMGQHYMDPVQYFLGKDNESPVSVDVDAPQQHPDAVGTWRRITFTYADGCQIILDGEAKDEKAAYIEGPKGKLYKGFASDIPDLERKLAQYPEPTPQITDFLESVRTREKFALNEINGHRSCTLVNMGLAALRLNRSLKYDSQNEQFIDDDAANRLIHQPMRGPWSI
ncbi:MAG: oxidoreductase [Sphingobacterium sp.]|jgi:predicted dehydrogenase|uniref:Gfo/Idh/MocA family oxidoreductase n=1 Tax=Sphingobacterium prati TaxID=2737006 RepID=UPI0015528403|nr:Gfo/Idh/MocA family oxidoreductase [Sphingobacterium prati]MDF2517168.1 oxidoreductase [Sphingobacterium sp.]NPE45128.1 Gfo/Idh/MocA family oxidoreductase [Sphingobacterium prati]